MNAPIPVLPEHFADESERRRLVDRLFDAGAVHYEAVIAAMSFGSGNWYRRDALKRAGLSAGMRLLDLATGTGTVARAAAPLVGPSGWIVGLDPSAGMLGEARRTVPVTLVRSYAEGLPLADRSFDFLSMGYALRHVADLDVTFREAHRVLRPGGTFLVLELVPPASRAARAAMRLYMSRIVPWLTGRLTRSPEARDLFRYYWDTIEHCVPAATILGALRGAGFERAERTTVFGFNAEYRGVRPA